MPSFPLINIAAASTNEPWFNDPPQPFYRVQRFLNKFGKLPISYFVYGGLDNVTERKPHIFERVGREGQHRGIFGVLSLDKIEKKYWNICTFVRTYVLYHFHYLGIGWPWSLYRTMVDRPVYTEVALFLEYSMYLLFTRYNY